MGTKALIAILVVLVVLFVVGVALPAASGGGGMTVPAGGVADTLRGLLERPLDLKADVQAAPADCVQDRTLVLPAGGTCTLAVRPDNGLFASTRKLELHLEQGLVAVAVAQPDGLAVNHALTPDDASLTISVFQKGATITLACTGLGQACRLDLP